MAMVTCMHLTGFAVGKFLGWLKIYYFMDSS